MSNFQCPECGVTLRHAARSCACGWGGRTGKSRVMDDQANAQYIADHKQMLATMESVATDHARQWTDERGITSPYMTREQRNYATAKYRDTMKRTMRDADVHPKLWAHSLKSDYIDGVVLMLCQINAASSALGEIWENRECRSISVQ